MDKIRKTFENHFQYHVLDYRQKFIVDTGSWPLWKLACEAILNEVKAQDFDKE